jgi:hypothetical protein
MHRKKREAAVLVMPVKVLAKIYRPPPHNLDSKTKAKHRSDCSILTNPDDESNSLRFLERLLIGRRVGLFASNVRLLCVCVLVIW